VAHIKPEHLSEPRDYRQWLKVDSDNVSDGCGDAGCAAAAVDDVLFESLSKRAWMDVLLQLIKVSIQVHFFVYCFNHSQMFSYILFFILLFSLTFIHSFVIHSFVYIFIC